MNTRSNISLNGTWQFWVDPAASLKLDMLPEGQSLDVVVPAPWQSQAEELRLYSGAAWYRRSFTVPGEWTTGGRVILGIDASDYFSEVYINEVKAGEHEGGYLPFELDVTGLVHTGENTLIIRVDDPPGIFPEIPHGKQGWYGPLSGLWQSVWLESRAAVHLRSLNLRPDLDSGKVEVDVSLSSSPNGPSTLIARVLGPDGKEAACEQAPVPFRSSQICLSLVVQEPRSWSPEQPDLYRLEVSLSDGTQPFDQVSKTFGFRKIEARDGRLYLNGELLYLRGALDQDYYPDTICSSPMDEYLEDQIRKAKELGLNCLRCHIKVADPRYYDAADRLGMLVWTELPNWSTLTDHSARRGRETLEGILERDGHHPAIIIWTIINEDWGTDLVSQPSHRRWLKETFRWFKAMDPTRLVVDNSACEPNFHIQTDIDDFHYYRAIPDHRKEWDSFVDAFANRAPFTFCPNGDSVRSGQEPLIVSEFGNWGLPDIELLKDDQGRDPWWFETGFEWSEAVVLPQGVRSRFHTLGLKCVFGSWQGFVEATQWQQYLAMKYQIEAMRRRPEISGYVITELTDVHWECNGLLDMKRNPKAYHQKFGAINGSTLLIPVWERVAYWQGEEACVGLTISHVEGQPLHGTELHWRVSRAGQADAAEGHLPVPTIHAGEVKETGMAHFWVPPIEEPCVWTLNMELHSANGELLAENHLELVFHPPVSGELGIAVYTPNEELRQPLHRLGCVLVDEPGMAQLCVTEQVDLELLGHLEYGARLLVLTGRSKAAGGVIPGVTLAAREGTTWDGDWASTFSWVKREGAMAALPGEPLIDHSFDQIIPEYVLLGWRDWEFPGMVSAGTVVGWVHKPAALIASRWYGQGKALICAFRLDDPALAGDPTALCLLEALLKQAVE